MLDTESPDYPHILTALHIEKQICDLFLFLEKGEIAREDFFAWAQLFLLDLEELNRIHFGQSHEIQATLDRLRTSFQSEEPVATLRQTFYALMCTGSYVNFGTWAI